MQFWQLPAEPEVHVSFAIAFLVGSGSVCEQEVEGLLIHQKHWVRTIKCCLLSLQLTFRVQSKCGLLSLFCLKLFIKAEAGGIGTCGFSNSMF